MSVQPVSNKSSDVYLGTSNGFTCYFNAGKKEYIIRKKGKEKEHVLRTEARTQVTFTAFAATNSYFAIALTNGAVHIIDLAEAKKFSPSKTSAETDKITRIFVHNSTGPVDLTWVSDHKLLILAKDTSTLRLYDPKTDEKKVFAYPKDMGSLTLLRKFDDQKVFLATDDGKVVILDPTNCSLLPLNITNGTPIVDISFNISTGVLALLTQANSCFTTFTHFQFQEDGRITKIEAVDVEPVRSLGWTDDDRPCCIDQSDGSSKSFVLYVPKQDTTVQITTLSEPQTTQEQNSKLLLKYVQASAGFNCCLKIETERVSDGKQQPSYTDIFKKGTIEISDGSVLYTLEGQLSLYENITKISNFAASDSSFAIALQNGSVTVIDKATKTFATFDHGLRGKVDMAWLNEQLCILGKEEQILKFFNMQTKSFITKELNPSPLSLIREFNDQYLLHVSRANHVFLYNINENKTIILAASPEPIVDASSDTNFMAIVTQIPGADYCTVHISKICENYKLLPMEALYVKPIQSIYWKNSRLLSVALDGTVKNFERIEFFANG